MKEKRMIVRYIELAGKRDREFGFKYSHESIFVSGEGLNSQVDKDLALIPCN